MLASECPKSRSLLGPPLALTAFTPTAPFLKNLLSEDQPTPWPSLLVLLYHNTSLMVRFMCQFDWVMRCPDIWSNTILHVSGRVFLDEINLWVCEWSRSFSLMWVGLIQSVEGLNPQNGSVSRKRPLVLPDLLRWDPSPFLCLDSNWNIHSSWV